MGNRRGDCLHSSPPMAYGVRGVVGDSVACMLVAQLPSLCACFHVIPLHFEYSALSVTIIYIYIVSVGGFVYLYFAFIVWSGVPALCASRGHRGLPRPQLVGEG